MSSIARAVRSVTKRYSLVQVVVRNATSNDPCGPTTAEMRYIAQLTFDTGTVPAEIMDMLDRRLKQNGKNWRHILKSLKVLDYVVHVGSEYVVLWANANIYKISVLLGFQYIDEHGQDQGMIVRTSARELVTLLLDDERLRNERCNLETWRGYGATESVHDHVELPVPLPLPLPRAYEQLTTNRYEANSRSAEPYPVELEGIPAMTAQYDRLEARKLSFEAEDAAIYQQQSPGVQQTFASGSSTGKHPRYPADYLLLQEFPGSGCTSELSPDAELGYPRMPTPPGNDTDCRIVSPAVIYTRLQASPPPPFPAKPGEGFGSSSYQESPAQQSFAACSLAGKNPRSLADSPLLQESPDGEYTSKLSPDAHQANARALVSSHGGNDRSPVPLQVPSPQPLWQFQPLSRSPPLSRTPRPPPPPSLPPPPPSLPPPPPSLPPPLPSRRPPPPSRPPPPPPDTFHMPAAKPVESSGPLLHQDLAATTNPWYKFLPKAPNAAPDAAPDAKSGPPSSAPQAPRTRPSKPADDPSAPRKPQQGSSLYPAGQLERTLLPIDRYQGSSVVTLYPESTVSPIKSIPRVKTNTPNKVSRVKTHTSNKISISKHPISDLIDHYKLETEFDSNYTKHFTYQTNSTNRRHRQRIEKTWFRDRKIGEGGFSQVWLEKEQDGKELRAVKVLKKSIPLDYNRELLAMARLSKHELLFVQFLGWYESQRNVYLAMEYFEHGDLGAFIDSVPSIGEKDAKVIVQQVLEGLDIMVQLNFTHRDLKPQNIFVISKSPSIWVKIGDFGLSKRLIGDTILQTQAYTKNYAAPEICGCHTVDNRDDNASFEYTNAVDIWSVGIITYEILTKNVPFRTDIQLVHYVEGRMTFPFKELNTKQTSLSAVSFIKRLLAPIPSNRPTAKECLVDVWLQNSEETMLEMGTRTFYPDCDDD